MATTRQLRCPVVYQCEILDNTSGISSSVMWYFPRVSVMYLVEQSVEYIDGLANGDGSSPDWGSTEYFFESIRDLWKSG